MPKPINPSPQPVDPVTAAKVISAVTASEPIEEISADKLVELRQTDATVIADVKKAIKTAETHKRQSDAAATEAGIVNLTVDLAKKKAAELNAGKKGEAKG